jgi:hypothetical protein
MLRTEDDLAFPWSDLMPRPSVLLIALAIAGVSFDSSESFSAAKPAGSSISLSVGYLSAWHDHNNFFVQGASNGTFASDNKLLAVTGETPTLWKSMYLVAATRWQIGNRYDTNVYTNHLSTTGAMVCAGLGYSLRAWESTLRLQVGAGYWWETVDIDFNGLVGGGAFKVHIDNVVLLPALSLSFPFAGRVNALVSYEFVIRGEDVFTGSFASGRDWRLETNGQFTTPSIGFVVGLGSNKGSQAQK